MMQAEAAVSRRSSRVPPAPSRLDVARRSRNRTLAVPGALNGEFRLCRLAGGTAANRAREPRRRIARARGRLAGLAHVPRLRPLYVCGSRTRHGRRGTASLAGTMLPLVGCCCMVLAGYFDQHC